jgi:hypothetical protein
VGISGGGRLTQRCFFGTRDAVNWTESEIARELKGETTMAVPGNWMLYYDWNSTGHYGSTSMTISANGTWSNGQGYKGTWINVAGILMFVFNNSKTTYAGNLADLSVTGIMSTFGGLSGSFYMLEQAPAAATKAAERAHAVADSSGKS